MAENRKIVNTLSIAEHDPSGNSGVMRLQSVSNALEICNYGVITSISSQDNLTIDNGSQLNLPLNKDFIEDQISSLKSFDINIIMIGLIHQTDAIEVVFKEITSNFPKAQQILLLANGNNDKNNISSEIINLNKKKFLPNAYISILPACCSDSITGISVFDIETALQASQVLSSSTNGLIIVLFEKSKEICCTVSLGNSSIFVKGIDIYSSLNYNLESPKSLSSLSYDLGMFIASILDKDMDFLSLKDHLDKISKSSKEL